MCVVSEHILPVGAAVRTWVMNAHNNKDMLEVRANVFGSEG